MAPARRPLLALCGKGWIAVEALEWAAMVLPVLAPAWRMAGLPVASDAGADTWEPSFRGCCVARGVPVAESVGALGLQPGDVLVSLQYDRIIPIDAVSGVRAFNLHFSLLPAHRGCYPAVWPLRDGDAQAGVTLHVLAAGIDEGPIVDQLAFDVPAHATAFDLYRLLHRQAARVFERALQSMLDGTATGRPQGPATGPYHDRRSIDFAQCELRDPAARTVAECDRFLRSLIFPPRQLPRFEGREVLGCEPVPWKMDAAALAALPARIDVSADSSLVRCRDGLLRIRFNH
ncbi:MAG: hypothetical protein K2W80_12275 [Burkholderiales bacterium]|nr:hypothetical protein [Burkholderiales bacterium]